MMILEYVICDYCDGRGYLYRRGQSEYCKNCCGEGMVQKYIFVEDEEDGGDLDN